MVAMVLLMYLLINDPTVPKDDIKPPGAMAVTISWKEGPIDVDLWLVSPLDEKKPVGYSHKSGVVWNLLRDDVGRIEDVSPLNFENAYARGMPPGRWVINIHCYSCPTDQFPIDVQVELGYSVDGNYRKLPNKTVTLNSQREEKTVMTFLVTEDGTIDHDSITDIYIPIRR